jgi:hypothetical protein
MKKKNKGEGTLRVRARILTDEETEQFLRTHPNFKSQILSVEDIERLAKTVPVTTAPGTISVVNGK